MTVIEPLNIDFNYAQEVPSDETTKTFLNEHRTIEDRLKNMFVFVQNTREQRLWLITPMHISKKKKKTFFYVDNGHTITVQSDETMAVAPYAITYDTFKKNIHTIMHKVKNRELLWVADKNEALREANNVSQILKHVAIDEPEYASHKVEVASLYDVLRVITPTFNNYLEQFEHEQH